MNVLKKSLAVLAESCEGNPVKTTLTTMLFFVMFTVAEAQIQRLIFGEYFQHWLEVVFVLAFIAYSAAAVWACAEFNSNLPD